MDVRCFIAMGANLGDRRANIDRAMELLFVTPGVRVVRISDLIETAAVGGPEGSPAYLNGAAELQTSLAPDELLARLNAIEAEIGRVRRIKWEPRVIDLDILLYGDAMIETPPLKVPHPLMHRRPFVLQPLVQIAPDAIHPRFNKTIRELLRELKDD